MIIFRNRFWTIYTAVIAIAITFIFLVCMHHFEIYEWWAFLFLTILYFFCFILLWYYYAKINIFIHEDSDEDSDQYLWNKLLNPLNAIWFWTLTLGMYAVILHYTAYYLSYDYKDPYNYFMGFLHHDAHNAFAVVIASLLADFVLHLFKQLYDFQERVKVLRETLNESLSDTEKMLNRVDTSFKTTKDETKILTKNVTDVLNEAKLVSNKINEASVKMNDVYFEFLKAISQTDRSKEFWLKISNDSTGIIKSTYKNIVQEFVDKSTSILNDYLRDSTLENGNNNNYIEKCIATNFMTTYIDHFTAGEKNNIVKANFAIMSDVVDKLFSAREIIYKEYNGKKIVYFTTLAMSLYEYFNPSIFLRFESAIDQWDEYRKKTRKRRYSLSEETSKYGHMKSFEEESEKYEFRRCCLWLDENIKLDDEDEDDNIPLLTKNSWDKQAEKRIKTFTPIGSPDDEMQDEYEDQLVTDEDIKSKEEIRAIDAFKSLYHPNADACRGLGLSQKNIKELFKDEKYEGNFDKLIERDDDKFIRLIESLMRNKAIDYNWVSILFKYIPLDIFAVGVKHDNGIIEWKGCLSGYIGDYFSIDLGWHDDIISPDEWKWISSFVDYYYRKSTPIIVNN